MLPDANTHIHLPPNFSAFESVEQAVSLAARQGVRALGTSNYYDFAVYADFAEAARRHRVFPLFGLEIIALLEDLQQRGVLVNDPGNPGRMYICGKGIARFHPMTADAQELMRLIRENDTTRMRAMVACMAEIFVQHGVNTGLDESIIIDGIVHRYGVGRETVCLQERHVAQAFQEAFFSRVEPARRPGILGAMFGVAPKSTPENAVGVQQEIRTHLMKVGKPAFRTETFLNFEQSYRLILELGGIPCYPTLADGAAPVCPYEDPPEKLIEVLRQNRIHCAEFIPIRNQPAVLEHYVRTIRAAGFVVTGGTEHNTPDLIPLVPTCVGGLAIAEDIRAVFWEGACVVAAHQHLVGQGRCGYVDTAGELNQEFQSAERRIEHFRLLGAELIENFNKR